MAFHEKKMKNGQIKGMISRRMLNLSYIINEVKHTVSTNFVKLLSAVVPEKSLTKISLCLTVK